MNENREKTIVRTSEVGILTNVLLAAFKAAVGFASSSVAVVMDAVNNLSDAISSVITIIGTKLASKSPDKKHPLGYGRIEYLSTMVIGLIVLYAGVTSLIESVKKIVEPVTPDYSATALIIIAVAVVAKVLLGLFMKKRGERVDSDSLVASGRDSLNDSIIGFSTLVAAGIYLAFNVSLEAWLGAVISFVVIKSGFDILRDTVSDILGERVAKETARAVKETICETEGVLGAYDLVITSYGPKTQIGSVHINVPESMPMKELDALERKISQDVYEKHHIFITGISIYCERTDDSDTVRAKNTVLEIVKEYPDVIQMHGFYIDNEEKTLKFDIIVSYDSEDRMGVYKQVVEKVQQAFPDYKVHVTLDLDISD
ncbi:MAG: cation diffusion facilitator family transporter [Coriobacteriales bacterium]|jgi:cation diffusion facilitator family transporter